jgi:hypothetical protein
MYFKCVPFAILTVCVVGSRASRAKTEDALKEIEATLAQELFQNSKTCSASFATGIAVAADIFANNPSAESFDAVLQETLNRGPDFIRKHYESLPREMFKSFSKPDLPSDIDTCFTFPPTSPKTTFYSMAQDYARLVVAAVRWTLVGQAGKPPASQALLLATVSESIVKNLSDDQLNVVYGMEYVTDFKNSLTNEVCKNRNENDPRISPALKESVTNLEIGFHGNFLPTLFRFLRRLASCVKKSVSRTSTIVANSPNYGPFLQRLKKQAHEADHVAEKSVAPDPNAEAGPRVEPRSEELSEASRISNKLDSQTTIISSIATQEKLFFTNFHIAAQQLSLLGIKAVGLATQIQTIRGHMMMLKLIDQHIGQLNDDHGKYTGLLEAALTQLEEVTESSNTST